MPNQAQVPAVEALEDLSSVAEVEKLLMSLTLGSVRSSGRMDTSLVMIGVNSLQTLAGQACS